MIANLAEINPTQRSCMELFLRRANLFPQATTSEDGERSVLVSNITCCQATTPRGGAIAASNGEWRAIRFRCDVSVGGGRPHSPQESFAWPASNHYIAERSVDATVNLMRTQANGLIRLGNLRVHDKKYIISVFLAFFSTFFL